MNVIQVLVETPGRLDGSSNTGCHVCPAYVILVDHLNNGSDSRDLHDAGKYLSCDLIPPMETSPLAFNNLGLQYMNPNSIPSHED
jgi:hypothetical protein